MKKLIVLISMGLVISCVSVASISAKEKVQSDTFVSRVCLTDDEMVAIFMAGYKEIITYTNIDKRTTGTYSVTTCTSMKKRGYDYIGYSNKSFQETYTSVAISDGSVSIALGLAGISVSIPFKNMSTSGSISLKDSDRDKVAKGTHYSVIRMKAYSTYATYTSKIYQNGTNQFIKSVSYNHTYLYKGNKKPGVDYYLVARTPSQCNEIKENKYYATNGEKKSMKKWYTVSLSHSMQH